MSGSFRTHLQRFACFALLLASSACASSPAVSVPAVKNATATTPSSGDCATLSQRLGVANATLLDPSSFQGQGLVAAFEGSQGVAIASATVEYRFQVLESLDLGTVSPQQTVSAFRLTAHPNAPFDVERLTAGERSSPVVGQLYLLYVSQDGVTQQLPLLSKDEAQPFHALIRSGSCTP